MNVASWLARRREKRLAEREGQARMDNEVFALMNSANRLLLRHGLGERFQSNDIAVILMVAIKLHEFADRLYTQLASEALHDTTDAGPGE